MIHLHRYEYYNGTPGKVAKHSIHMNRMLADVRELEQVRSKLKEKHGTRIYFTFTELNKSEV